MTDFPTYDTVLDCGCSLASGKCAVHAAMSKDLYDKAYRGSPLMFHTVGRYADGFGTPGDNYGDWSAWRDSTVAAIEVMWSLTNRLLRSADTFNKTGVLTGVPLGTSLAP